MTGSKLIASNNRIVKRRMISGRDLLICASLIACMPVAILVPQSYWKTLCTLAARIMPASLQGLACQPQIAKTLDLDPETAARISRKTLAARLTVILAFLRGLVRGPGYDIELEGQEHLDNALGKKRGVVIWIADLVYANDVPKIALSKHGYLCSHLSRPEHGFSDTQFGVRFLNQLRQKFELRHLKERIVYSRERPAEAGEKMRARLEENGIVSILACATEGRAYVEAEILGHRLQLAGGAPRLAFKQNCDVLPVFIEPAPEFPRFRVAIGAPLKMTSDCKDAVILEATGDYLARLERVVRRNLHLWRSWPYLLTGPTDAAGKSDRTYTLGLRRPVMAARDPVSQT